MIYHDTFKDILAVVEKNSTCARLKVGALLVKDGRIVSTGWNGAVSGSTHCTSIFNKDNFEGHHKFSEERELHAEQNAIAYAARNGIATDGAELYVSISPCSNCAKLIIASGIKRVYYKESYDRSSAGLELLFDSNIDTRNIGK